MYNTKQLTLLDRVQNSRPIQNLVVSNGIITYKNIIGPEKKYLFKQNKNIYARQF